MVLTMVAFGVFPGVACTQDPEHEDPNVVRQNPDSSPSPDSAIIAAETGLPVDQIVKALAFQDEFSAYAGELISSFPGQISAIWMDSPLSGIGPNTRGNIRFVGEVPSEAMFKEKRPPHWRRQHFAGRPQTTF